MYIEIPLEDVKSISLSETDDCYVVAEQELETVSGDTSGVLTLSY